MSERLVTQDYKTENRFRLSCSEAVIFNFIPSKIGSKFCQFAIVKGPRICDHPMHKIQVGGNFSEAGRKLQKMQGISIR